MIIIADKYVNNTLLISTVCTVVLSRNEGLLNIVQIRLRVSRSVEGDDNHLEEGVKIFEQERTAP